MIIGIDASNLRSGGGITHLVELLRSADPRENGFKQLIVWGGHDTLSKIDNRPWLVKSHQPLLDGVLVSRIFWQRFKLSRLAKAFCCDVLFVPGGSYVGDFAPFVTMSRNMLPFDVQESRRFGLSPTFFRLMLLRWLQIYSYRKSDGLIFLTQFAEREVLNIIKSRAGITTIIPHGVSHDFRMPPRVQKPISEYSADKPIRVLYVSIVNVYKHQWHVVNAIALLRKKGIPVVLDLVGPAYLPALKRLERTINVVDPSGKFIRYSGAQYHDALNDLYYHSDIFLFASSCENMPNVLLEGMASGLPIACSDRASMPEVLQDAGVYFDPEDVLSIVNALELLIAQPELRSRLASRSYLLAEAFSWERCAQQTFSFISTVVGCGGLAATNKVTGK